jgi:hypothetical protein
MASVKLQYGIVEKYEKINHYPSKMLQTNFTTPISRYGMKKDSPPNNHREYSSVTCVCASK